MYEKPKGLVALDLETHGLNPWVHGIIMAGFFDGHSFVACRTREHFREVFKTYTGYSFVGHNVVFDFRFLLVLGWITQKEFNELDIHDTQLMAHVCTTKVPQAYLEQYEAHRRELNEELPKGVSHRATRALSLKVLAPWFLKVSPFWEIPGNHDNEEYNRLDCEYTYRLFHRLWDQMGERELSFYHKRMLPWSKMLLEMQLTGIQIDMNKIEEMERELQIKNAVLKVELDEQWADAHTTYLGSQRGILNVKYQEMAQKACEKSKDPLRASARYNQLLLNAVAKIEPLNYASPAQMKWLLKDHLGLDITTIDDEDEESTDKAVLNRLANEGRQDVAKFLEWRKTNKILTAFLPTYKELQVNGVLHPTFNITGTRTGRTSSSNPNLQQVPSGLYQVFRPRPGYRFIIYDLSGIEAALIALYSDDARLYDIISKGESVHDHNTRILFDLDCPVEDIKRLYPKERQCSKNLGFAIFYGAGWRRLIAVFQAAGFSISEKEAKIKLNKLKVEYKSVFGFHQDVTDLAVDKQPIENLFGRPIVIPEPRDAYMKAFNTLVQSGASDLNLRACALAQERWAQQGLTARPLLTIHDCIVAEAKIEDCEQAEKILVDAMTGFKLESSIGPIKLSVEGGVSDEWKKG